MQNNTLLIVSNKSDLIDSIKPKLGLSRKLDKVVDTSLKTAMSFLKNCMPDAILFVIDEPDEKILDCCREIKANNKYKLTPIIFYIEKNYDKKFMEEAFSIGLDDFIYCPIDDSEVAIRIKANLNKRAAFVHMMDQQSILKDFDVINEQGIYSDKFSKKIFDINVENVRNFNHSFISMLFSFNEPQKLVGQLKSQARLSDVVGHLSKNVYYVIMPKTALDRSKSFYKKVKENLDGELNASACEYNSRMSFKDITTISLKALKEATVVGDILVLSRFCDTETFEGSVTKKRGKNYKLFQKAFDKKMQNVILPAFQNIKSQLDTKYPYNVKIDFFSAPTKCYFSIQHIPTKVETAFKVSYFGYSKLDLETIYTQSANQTTNSIEIDLNDIDEKIINKVVNNVINEFDRLVD